MNQVEVKVPSLGESETEATLVHWLKKEGDSVQPEEVLAEIESDKITMEIPATDAGILKEIRKKAGETVHPGEVIGIIEAVPVTTKQPAKGKETRSEKAQAFVEEKKPEPPEREEVEAAAMPLKEEAKGEVESEAPTTLERLEERVPMSGLRRRIAQRLKDAQNTAAILTTFNEVNMHTVVELRRRYREAFAKKHGVDLGLMSFFVRASVEALRQFPIINACIDGEDIVYRNYHDIGIAVATPRGLVVPVLRNADQLSMAEIERGIQDLAKRAREGGLLPDDLKGGTFSITNGGVFGSLLSTPILNPPQSAILGMHAIQKRPVVEEDAIVIRPMMYLALSYDHRLIDGREAVLFLRAIKEYLEFPAKELLDL